MTYEITCLACDDTGVNSKGGACHPCEQAGRAATRDAVVMAVRGLWAGHKPPTEDEVLAAVRRAMVPRAVYAAGFKGKGRMTAFFAGPSRDIEVLLDSVPPDDPYARKAFIVRMVRGTEPDEQGHQHTPLYRWNGLGWVARKK